MFERVAEIIANMLKVPLESLTQDTSFKQDIRADSFELMELVMALEEEYGFQILEEDLETFDTIGDIMDFIKDQGIDD